MDERTLAKKLRRKRRGALEQAVEYYTPYVSAAILRTLSGRACREDVEELTAEVFLTLWTRAETLDPKQDLRTWLSAEAQNRASAWSIQPEEDGTAQDRTERRMWSARVWAAMETLPELDRRLLFRYYYEGDDLKTIARDLTLTQDAAEERLTQGRGRLKAALLDETKEGVTKG